jgi:hypothetical protein
MLVFSGTPAASEAIGRAMRRPMISARPTATVLAISTSAASAHSVRQAAALTASTGIAMPRVQPLSVEVEYGV